ncbi:hypothetical protein Ddye_021573 [Dipteronia dyeriana]|uniref:GH10 domain-containing protein n=1 Tax=Dipteronia dyeriana TaxID=168575 RepID=A0AAD9U2C3_9ROSI|nr:hypothetical protein Ddye_021573 [Dipteronia dyeriana]
MWGKGNEMEWLLGNGTLICIYKDNWVPRPNTFKILSPPSLGVNMTIDRLLSPSGGWDMQVLKQNFMSCDVDAMLEIPIGAGVPDDSVVWHFEASDGFSVKSGYWVEREMEEIPSPSGNSGSIHWWRNSFVHNGSQLNCLDVVWWSINFVDEYHTPSLTQKPRVIGVNGMVAHWRPLKAGFYKSNCGAVNEVGESRVGIGIMIRNDSGLIMASCSQIIEANFDGQVAGTIDVYRADMMALYNGMDIKANPKMANRVAQDLANHALKITGDIFWMEDIPSCLRSTTEADMPT